MQESSDPTFRRVFVVLNPVGGTCDPQQVRDALARHAPGADLEFYETTGADDEDIPALVRAAVERGLDLAVAAGGDGTVSQAAAGLLGSPVPLAIIPTGTANVLARELGVPVDVDGAAGLMDAPHGEIAIDALDADGHIALLQIGIGLDSLMIRDTAREEKRRLGRLAYLRTALAHATGFQHPRFSITVDGKRLRPRAMEVLIANGGTLGVEPLRWGEDIRPDDGRADICIVSARTLRDYLSIAWHTLIGRHRANPNLRYYQARESVSVVADTPLPVQADGEIIGTTPVRVRVMPSAVRLLVPAPGQPVGLLAAARNLAAAVVPEAAGAEPVPQGEAPAAPSQPADPQRPAPAGAVVREALREIKTPEDAERAVDRALAAASGTTEREVREQASVEENPARAVARAAAQPDPAKAAGDALLKAAEQVAARDGEERAALEEELQEAVAPELRGAEADPAVAESRNRVREAVLRRMQPYQEIDTRLFLLINQMPHPPLANQLMYVVTSVMNGGFGWVVLLLLATVLDGRRGRRALYQCVPPLWFATMSVEYPVKFYFRRRRPFYDIVQAIAVGKKPGGFSFPSGHSAAAFAGAWLLTRHYPRLAPLWYLIAALVGFTRIYLGAHYPGDVISGAAAGTLIAETTRRIIEAGDDLSP